VSVYTKVFERIVWEMSEEWITSPGAGGRLEIEGGGRSGSNRHRLGGDEGSGGEKWLGWW
jgi:hypothetical protein